MITKTRAVVNECKCERCGHKWRSLVVPTRCPNRPCSASQWNVPEAKQRRRVQSINSAKASKADDEWVWPDASE